MPEAEFLKQMEDVLDTETNLTLDTKLDELEEWDSLALVSFIAMADVSFGKKISRSIVQQAHNVGDLYALVR